MALVAFDGFDNYNTAGSPAFDLVNRRGGGFQWTLTSATFGSPGRTGSGSYVTASQNSGFSGALTAPLTTGIFGFAIQTLNAISSYAGNPNITLNDNIAGKPQIVIVCNQFGNGFAVYRYNADGNVLLAVSGNNAITWSAWNYVEIEATIDPSAGSVTIRSNGQILLAATGLNTRATTRSQFDGISFNAPSAPTGSILNIDDFYIADTTTGPGPFAFNTFVGDVRVATLNTVGAGATTQWTPLSGANWQQVAEVHCDDDVSYNYTNTVGDEDLFNFAALTGTIDNILAVQVTGCYRKDDAGFHTVAQQLVSGATAAVGATYSIPVGYVYLSDFWTTDPNTALAAWSQSAVNALQAGYKLTA